MKKAIEKIIDKWFTSECKNKCDPKTHMKVVSVEEIEKLKSMFVEEKTKKVIDVSGQKIKIIKDLTKRKDCFIYLDPPYYPTAKTKGGKISPYRLYNADYTPVDFLKLKIRLDELTKEGIPFILSNSDCEFIRILFKDYPIVEIQEPRGMKPTKGKGSKPKEQCLIITNFANKEDFMGKINELNKSAKKKCKDCGIKIEHRNKNKWTKKFIDSGLCFGCFRIKESEEDPESTKYLNIKKFKEERSERIKQNQKENNFTCHICKKICGNPGLLAMHMKSPGRGTRGIHKKYENSNN